MIGKGPPFCGGPFPIAAPGGRKNTGVNGVAENWRSELTDQLCRAIVALESEEEACDFLVDVATIGEIRALAQRLEVARLLENGDTYPQISQQTGVSPATISRVKKFLEYGADGYHLVLNRLKAEKVPHPTP